MVRDFDEVVAVVVDLHKLAHVRPVENAIGPAGHSAQLVVLKTCVLRVVVVDLKGWRKANVSLSEAVADTFYALLNEQLVVHREHVPLVASDQPVDDLGAGALNAVVEVTLPNHHVPVLQLV